MAGNGRGDALSDRSRPPHDLPPGGPAGAAGEGRRRRVSAARLYLIVSPAASAAWEDAVRAALATGLVDLVQLRSKGPEGVLRGQAERLRALAEEARVPWILNDRPDLARVLGADGAHVGEDDAPPAEARRLLGPDLLLGVSTHDEAEVARASAEGIADYAGLGPCYPTRTKELSRGPGGPALVRRCAPRAGSLPLFPIGGITPANAPDLVRAGARRLAVGSGVLAAVDPAEAVRALDRTLRGESLPRCYP